MILLIIIDGVKLVQNLKLNVMIAISNKDVYTANKPLETTQNMNGQQPKLDSAREFVTKWTAL